MSNAQNKYGPSPILFRRTRETVVKQHHKLFNRLWLQAKARIVQSGLPLETGAIWSELIAYTACFLNSCLQEPNSLADSDPLPDTNLLFWQNHFMLSKQAKSITCTIMD